MFVEPRSRGRAVIISSLLLVGVNCATCLGADVGSSARYDSCASFVSYGTLPGEGLAGGSSDNPGLVQIAEELFKPPGAGVYGSLGGGRVTTLPGVPAAILLTLSGFIWISLVKDRKIWLAGVTALLWLGQAGLLAIPELAWHIASKKQIRHQHAGHTGLPNKALGRRYRPRCDIEGTRYIGLLRYLAGIPAKISPTSSAGSLDKLSAKAHPAAAVRTSGRGRFLRLWFAGFAIVSLADAVFRPAGSLVRTIRHFVCFLPAFALPNLARGPPVLAPNRCSSF